MKQSILLFLGALALAGAAQAQDAAAGERKAYSCIGCHGLPRFQASFPQVYKVPMISGQNAKFIVAALQAYQRGDRKHPTMRATARTLSNQDMADLAAYYEKQGAATAQAVADAPAHPPSPEVAALLAKGACASCHGANYNKPIDGAFPKIAGQHGDYLSAALQSYAVEGNPNVGRSNPIMSTQVKQFKRSELKLIAEYLASLPGDVRTVQQPEFR